MADKSDANPSRSSKTGATEPRSGSAAASTKVQDVKVQDVGDVSAGAPSAPNANAEAEQIQQDLQQNSEQYLETVAKVYQDASKKYLDLVSRLAENLHKLQQDAAKSDPSAPFAVEVLRAYKTHDLNAAVDAHRMLGQTLQNTTATAAKRLADTLKAAHDEYLKLCGDTQKELQRCAKQYSAGVLNTAKNTVPRELDRTSAAVLGHSLLLSALIMPDQNRSKAA